MRRARASSVDGVWPGRYVVHTSRQAMKIAIEDIKASPKALSYTEEVDDLNESLGRG